ncbi:MAG: T9SS type A sorting domain-containing protein [Ignavibacteriae bacterium]|nr:T9SS type A sorting domain-containing protein [Ignavibacteriota bacterium]
MRNHYESLDEIFYNARKEQPLFNSEDFKGFVDKALSVNINPGSSKLSIFKELKPLEILLMSGIIIITLSILTLGIFNKQNIRTSINKGLPNSVAKEPEKRQSLYLTKKTNLLDKKQTSLTINDVSIEQISNEIQKPSILPSQEGLSDLKNVQSSQENNNLLRRYQVEVKGIQSLELTSDELAAIGITIDPNAWHGGGIKYYQKFIGKNIELNTLHVEGGLSQSGTEYSSENPINKDLIFLPSSIRMITDNAGNRRITWFDENMISNLDKDLNTYLRINKWISIKVNMGKNPIKNNYNSNDEYAFILWFEPTNEFIEKLPEKYRNKINKEINAIVGKTKNCQIPPKTIAGEEPLLDIWRACNGAIENLRIYPNPTSEIINVDFNLTSKRNVRIILNDLSGAKILELIGSIVLDIGIHNKIFHLNNIEPGMYLISIISDYGEQAVQRIIVEK